MIATEGVEVGLFLNTQAVPERQDAWLGLGSRNWFRHRGWLWRGLLADFSILYLRAVLLIAGEIIFGGLLGLAIISGKYDSQGDY